MLCGFFCALVFCIFISLYSCRRFFGVNGIEIIMIMKKSQLLAMFALLMCFYFVPVVAQESDAGDDQEYQEYEDVRFFFSLPHFKYALVDNDASPFMGAKLSLLLGSHYYAGVSGARLLNKKTFGMELDGKMEDNLQLGYGSLALDGGRIFLSEKLIQLFGGVELGGGNMHLLQGDAYIIAQRPIDDNFFYAAPYLNVVYCPMSFIRLAFGVGYQYHSGISNQVYSDSDFNSPYFSAALLLGTF